MSHQQHTHHKDEHIYMQHECDGEGHQHHHHADGSCCCEQHAKEFHGIDKPMLLRLILAALCYLAGMLLPLDETVVLILMLLAALAAGYDVILTAVRNLLKGRFFDEYFLMSFAAIAAFAIGEFEEGAAVFLLYRIGAFCQSYAIRHSRRTIAGLEGDHILQSEEGQGSNHFITRFARVYTPIVLILAAVIAAGLIVLGSTPAKDAIYRALTFLVLACPCAIVISVPLTYFAGIGAASKRGIFFHNAESLDAVAQHKGSTVPPAGLLLTGDATQAQAVKIAAKTRRIAMENVCFTILVKLAVLVLGALGISALWFAVFADSGVTVIVVLNALRAFHIRDQVNVGA